MKTTRHYCQDCSKKSSQRRAGRLARFSLFFIVALCCGTSFVRANTLEEVKIQVLPDGYEITLESLFAYQFKNVTPGGKGQRFFIKTKTNNYQNLTADEIASIRENAIPGWDQVTGLPLQSLSINTDDAENLQFELVFTDDVEIDVRNSADLRSLIIKVTTAAPPPSVVLEGQEGRAISLPEAVAPEGVGEAQLMVEAKDALTKGEYDRAVQLYIKILLAAQGAVKQQAQELLGVARERNGQLAHASAEYQKYLKEYPKGPDADRVRQRLAGVVTAAQAPKEGLKEPLTKAEKAKAEQGLWTSNYFGSISQFYYWDALKPHGGKSQTSVNNLSSDMDLNARWKSRTVDMGARFTGGAMNTFREGSQDEDRVSAFSFDWRAKRQGFYTRVGRQSLSTGGVLGRFDGVQVSQQINPIIKLNGVYGYPVESVKVVDVLAEKSFEGVSIDWGSNKQRWNFNTYLIQQQNSGLIDRRALGAEARYSDPHKALFSILDYDEYFKEVNIFLFNSRWTLPTKTTLSLSGDYRKSPLLMVNNAIQGMGVSEINDLKDRFTNKELRQLAKDRAVASRTLSIGISQDLNANLQWMLEAFVSAVGSSITSGGVDGSVATGPDFTYTTELVASNVFKEEDSIITGLGYTDTEAYDDYSLNLNMRYPLTKKLRVNPRVRLNFRELKGSTDHRTAIRPLVHLDIQITKSANLELEAGAEWVSEITSGERQRSMEEFVTTGYRVIF